MLPSISELYARQGSWLVDHPRARKAVRVGIVALPALLAVMHPCPGGVWQY